MRPICAACATEMRCEKNGVPLTIGMHFDVHWGDRYRCQSCDAAVIVGVSASGKPVGQCSLETLAEVLCVE